MATTATSTEWSRVLNTTIRDHLKQVEDSIFRRRVLLSKLKKKGRIVYNCSGDGFDWRVKFSRADMEVNNGQQTVTFSGTNRHQTAYLDYQGYLIQDTVSKREKLKNRGLPAIVKVFDRMSGDLMEDMEEQFSEEPYIDGSASGNTGRWHGMESFGGVQNTNETISVSTGAARSKNAADPCYWPEDTYAGLSTELGAISGSWGTQSDINSVWPFGTGDPDYDYFTPVIVQYGSTAFDGSSTTWQLNAVRATRFAIRALKRNSANTVPLTLLPDGMYRQYLDNLDSKERIIVKASKDMADLGFEDSIFQDGSEITSEFGVPNSTGYGLSLDSVQVRSMQDTLFSADPVEWNQGARQFQFAIDCLGQFKFRTPRDFFFLKGSL